MKREGEKRKKSTMGPGEKREGGDQERHPPAKGGGGEGLRRSRVSDPQPEGGALGEDRKFPFSLFCFPRTQNLLVGDVSFFLSFLLLIVSRLHLRSVRQATQEFCVLHKLRR